MERSKHKIEQLSALLILLLFISSFSLNADYRKRPVLGVFSFKGGMSMSGTVESSFLSGDECDEDTGTSFEVAMEYNMPSSKYLKAGAGFSYSLPKETNIKTDLLSSTFDSSFLASFSARPEWDVLSSIFLPVMIKSIS